MPRRLAIVLLVVAACRTPPPAAPPGRELRNDQLAVPCLSSEDRPALASDGVHTYVACRDGVAVIDWQARTVTQISDGVLVGSTLLIQRGDHYEWPGGSATATARPEARVEPVVAPGAAVPLVLLAADGALEGWRDDGTRAWRIATPEDVELRQLAHLGELVLLQTVGGHREGYGWSGGATLVLDAATGAERWRHDAGEVESYPVAEHVLAHGDQLALSYESPGRVDIMRRDGTPVRTILLEREVTSAFDRMGFDGDSLWLDAYWPPHDNPGDHMLGTFPRDPSPSHCTYEVYDARTRRTHAVRTGEHAVSAPLWLAGCQAHALIPLADGGVQILVVPEPGVLFSAWYDRAP